MPSYLLQLPPFFLFFFLSFHCNNITGMTQQIRFRNPGFFFFQHKFGRRRKKGSNARPWNWAISDFGFKRARKSPPPPPDAITGESDERRRGFFIITSDEMSENSDRNSPWMGYHPMSTQPLLPSDSSLRFFKGEHAGSQPWEGFFFRPTFNLVCASCLFFFSLWEKKT